MTSTPSARVILIVGFAALTLGPSFHDLARGFLGRVATAVREESPSPSSGACAAVVGRLTREESPIMRGLRPFWSAAMLRAFDATSGFVVKGRRDWLFAGWSLLPLDPERSRRALEEKLAFVDQVRELDRRGGSRTIVIVIPSKWRIHGDCLARSGVPTNRRQLLPLVLESLRARGVEAPDVDHALLAARLSDPDLPIYHPADSHLSRRGCEILVSSVLAPLFGVSESEAGKRIDALPRVRTDDFGNLAALLDLDPDAEPGRRYRLQEVSADAPSGRDAEGSDLVLLGDSHAYYHDRLVARLLGPATRLTVDARFATGLDESRAARLMQDYASKPPKAVLLFIDEKSFASH